MISEEQRGRLESAIAEWPERAGLSWDVCGLGVLCQKAGITIPSIRECNFFKYDGFVRDKIGSSVESVYGLPRDTQNRLHGISIKLFKRQKTKSREQKSLLRIFLENQIS